MSLTDTQIQFAAEFVTLIVAASGIAIAVLRPPGMRSYAAGGPSHREMSGAAALSVLGFAIAGAAAFAHGSLIVGGDPDGALGIARIASAAALIPAAFAWASRWSRRAPILVAVLCWALAGAIEMSPLSGLVVDSLLVAGSLAVGSTIVWLSRHSVAAKVAASAAATLLLVVVVLAVALSAVISSSLQRDDLNQLGDSARTESGQIVAMVDTAVKDARFGAKQLESDLSAAPGNPLITIGNDVPGTNAPAAAAEAVTASLRAITELYPSGFAYADPSATVVTAVGQVDAPSAERLAEDLQAKSLSCIPGGQASQAQGILVEGAGAWVAAASPVCETGVARLLGAVIDATPLDSAYLASRSVVDRVPTLALVSSGSVLAVQGAQPSRAALRAAALPFGTRVLGSSLVGSVPIDVASPSPPLSVLLVTPSTNEQSTRNRLFRTLFLIALGGTVLALGLAIFVGDRITSGVRRLTQVASRIGQGDRALRSDVRGDDEVSTLGTVFNSMLDSVQDQANALQAAADDETRLRNRMEAVVAGMTDGLVAVDSTGCITDFNRAAEELTGTEATSAVGQPVDQVVLMTAEDGSSLGPRLVDPGPAPWSRIATIDTYDEGPVPVAVSSGAVRGPAGELIGKVFLLRDLRREREVERMKDEFLSRIGHELRTPLTPIKAYADLLLRKQSIPPEQAGSWYSEIRRSSDQLQRIVEMLEFSASSGAGRLLLRFDQLDLRGLVRSITATWAENLPDNISIGRKVARDLPMVLADKRWLSKALDELIGNAVKFSPDGGRIVVSASVVPAAGTNGSRSRNARPEQVEISVTDHGVGMASDQAALMFGDFVQGDASDTRAFGGLGLGLTLVQRVVEGHGGSIRCRSERGRGSTFILRIPIRGGADIPHRERAAVLG